MPLGAAGGPLGQASPLRCAGWNSMCTGGNLFSVKVGGLYLPKFSSDNILKWFILEFFYPWCFCFSFSHQLQKVHF